MSCDGTLMAEWLASGDERRARHARLRLELLGRAEAAPRPAAAARRKVAPAMPTIAPGTRWAVRGPTTAFTGYGRLVEWAGRGLDAAGMLAGFVADRTDTRWLPPGAFATARLLPDAGASPVLRFDSPDMPRVEGATVAFTMWESSRISPTAVATLNQCAAVVVPCRWNAESFRACGVARPIHVVPLGVDLAAFTPGAKPPGPFVVGMAARLSHGGVRKGIAEGARAFLEAFGDDPDVRLEIKCFPDCLTLLDVPDDPRIWVQPAAYDAGRVLAWYRGLDALLVPSKAEGWGLHTMEALACGVPVLAAKATGTAEFFDDAVGWELPSEAAPARGCYEGLGEWYPPTHDGMVAALRECRSDGAARRRKALRARDRAEAYPWERTGRELAAVLRGLEARPKARAGVDATRPACPWLDRCNCTEAKCHHPGARAEFGDARGRVDAAACRRCGGRAQKVITMTAWTRPDYLKQVLDALRRCDGIGDYLLLPHVEPGCDEVRAIIESIDFAACRPTFNRARLGVNLNTGNALRAGFAASDYVVHVEDDIVLAPDGLRYFEWARDEFRGDPGVFSVAAYHRRSEPAPAIESHAVRRRRWFHPWGWATWRDRWARIEPLMRGDSHTFDQHVLARVAAPDSGLVEVYPELSRSQNIGVESSLHPELGAEWFAEHHRLRHWAGTGAIAPGTFGAA